MTKDVTAAALRRALALLPDAGRQRLVPALSEVVLDGPLPRDTAVGVLTDYLLDPAAGAILSLDDSRRAWLELPAFTWLGPGNGVPLDDQLAALLVGPSLARGAALAEPLVRARFAPRADDVVALAVGALDESARAGALEALFTDPGPDADLLALSTVQCGRAVAWNPSLHALPIAERIVDALLARITPGHPGPHLEAVARALGPIGSQPGSLGDRVRASALAGLETLTSAARPSSFRDRVRAISDARGDLARFQDLPRREAAAAYAYILGFGAPIAAEAFAAYRQRVLERPDGDELFAPFVEGLLARAHVPALLALVENLISGELPQITHGLELAARLPLDELAPVLVAFLDAPDAPTRIGAIAAVEMLEASDDLAIDHALAMRLGDPSPEVCAAASWTLAERGRRDILGKHSAREPSRPRRAAVMLALGELSVPTVGELAVGLMDGLDGVEPMRGPEAEAHATSPILRLVGRRILGSVRGLELASELVAASEDAVGVLSLSCLTDLARDVGVLAPPEQRSRLARVTMEIATEQPDSELGALALFLLARMSAGDAMIAELVADAVADAIARETGYAGQLLSALGELRVASEKTGAALAPLLGPATPIGARVTATAIAGRVLPADHAAWAHVRELLDLGTFARAAAWTALRDRARRGPST
ncbi:MAG TPA: hypothetical protein VM513_14660 [Kofleriaceae bacterium]|nr:hypothetical protein [Kofleriaceae bacterium]